MSTLWPYPRPAKTALRITEFPVRSLHERQTCARSGHLNRSKDRTFAVTRRDGRGRANAADYLCYRKLYAVPERKRDARLQALEKLLGQLALSSLIDVCDLFSGWVVES